MWKTDLGIVSGWFEYHRDGNFIAVNALLKSYHFGHMQYIGDLDVPDDTVVAIVDSTKSNKGRIVKWGLTCFDSEDSVVVGES